jgi:hypothetical protein
MRPDLCLVHLRARHLRRDREIRFDARQGVRGIPQDGVVRWPGAGWRALRTDTIEPGRMTRSPAFRRVRCGTGGPCPQTFRRKRHRRSQLTAVVHESLNFPIADRSRAGDFALELFHGPTLAFRISARGSWPADGRTRRRVTVLTATSGDTGRRSQRVSRDCQRAVVILYPDGRVSRPRKRS